jgi:hypothetical protein
MKINESSIDSVIRIFPGFFLLYLGLGGILAFGAVILVVVVLLTGVIGTAPLSSVLKN